jgi:hypothetical protein
MVSSTTSHCSLVWIATTKDIPVSTLADVLLLLRSGGAVGDLGRSDELNAIASSVAVDAYSFAVGQAAVLVRVDVAQVVLLAAEGDAISLDQEAVVVLDQKPQKRGSHF